MARLTKDYIIKTLEKYRTELKEYGVKRIGLFGSFNKGLQNKKSDLDFLVTLENSTFDSYMDLKFFLEKVFHRKVDLVIEESLKPALQYVRKEAMYVKTI